MYNLQFAECVSSDIDECNAEVDICGIHATCTNTEGSLTCTCSYGYTSYGALCEGKERQFSSANYR